LKNKEITMTNDSPEIKYLFEPRSVAVIGASLNPNKIGFKIVQNIIEMGYQGKVYPVNPRGGEILGHSVYTSLEDIDGEIDVAVISIPAPFVLNAVKTCGINKVKFLIIISSGFSEIGNLEEERKIIHLARKYNIRILGPNIFGYYSAKSSLNASFGPGDIQPGHVAIITQSGALGVSMIGKTSVQNIGLSAIISVGNKADIDEADLLEYLVDQIETKIILIYMEGIHDGAKLVRTLKNATRKKPVIMIKSGRSKRGALAAASHTGSLAGSDAIFDAIIKQCGVIRAENITDALNWCKYLSHSPMPSGLNTVIITNGGGIGVMATDACEKYGVKLYEDAERLKTLFHDVTPEFGSTKNPIDLTAEASGEEYMAALRKALYDNRIHSVMGFYGETAFVKADQLSAMITQCSQEYIKKGKPFIFSTFGGYHAEQIITILSRDNYPVYRDVYEAASCLGALYSFYRNQMDIPRDAEELDVDMKSINCIVDEAMNDDREFLLAHEGQRLLEAIGLSCPKSGVAHSISDAVALSEKIGYPVVMKVISRDILHKSDVGGVLLNLENRNEVIDAYQTILHNCKSFRTDVVIEGIEVVEQIKPGTEVIIGARRDRTFGPIVMFGMGGIYVEVMKDVSFRALPLSRHEIRLMVKEIKSYPLLLGVRGERRKDIRQIEETILKIGAVIQHCKKITDIEINPLVVYDQGRGVKSVDVRVLLTKNERTE